MWLKVVWGDGCGRGYIIKTDLVLVILLRAVAEALQASENLEHCHIDIVTRLLPVKADIAVGRKIMKSC